MVGTAFGYKQNVYAEEYNMEVCVSGEVEKIITNIYPEIDAVEQEIDFSDCAIVNACEDIDIDVLNEYYAQYGMDEVDYNDIANVFIESINMLNEEIENEEY